MMKYRLMKIIFTTIGTIGLALVFSGTVFAQGMMNRESTIQTDNHTAEEVAEGKAIFEQMQSKEKSCADLSDEQFAALGEYYMEQMAGSSHQAMNAMMEQMMGKESEEQMHVVMGKRLSGCDTSAAFPSQSVGVMPMMPMMGGWSSPSGFNKGDNTMMNSGFTPFGWFGWIFMVLWWALIIAGIVALIRWLAGQSGHERHFNHEKSPLEILKERYARGEIDKKEFEDKKRDLL